MTQKTIWYVAAATAAVLATSGAAATAQSVPSTDQTTYASSTNQDEGFNWGWLGLLGLAGLAGLRSRKDTHRDSRTVTA